MVLTFQHQEFCIFVSKRAITFQNFDIFPLIQVFPDPGARKYPKGLKNKLLTKLYWPWNGFQTFLCHKFWQIFDKTCFFSFFFEKFCQLFFWFFQPQEPKNFFYSLKIDYGTIYRCNGMSCKTLTSQTIFRQLLPIFFLIF